MKSTVEHLSPTRVRINVEVPFDELKPNFERAYKEIAQQVRIPGFRPGKVPARVLESRIGRGPILEEVVNDALPSKYMQAVETNEVRPLGQPEFEITKLEDGDEVAFSAAVDVRPELELPEFSSLSATVDSLEIADKDVQEELDNLRARFGTLVGVERPAAQGDFTNIDLKATVDGEPVEGADSEGMSYEVGSGDLIEGLDDALVGLSAGEQATFTTKLVGGEHAGKEAEVTVTLNSVKFRELPEADDEFAQMASEFDTIEELQADLRSKVENTKQVEQQRQARDKVLEALVGQLEVPLPEAVLNTEIENRKRHFMQMFGQQEFDEATWQAVVQQMGEDAEGFEDNLKTSAEQNLRHQLVLDTIADREELSADDQEMTQHILYNAQRYGVSPEQYVQYAQNSGELGMIYGEIRRNKALQVVLEQATVTDAEGNVVNASVLGGESEKDDAEQAGTDGEDADASDQVEADSSEESSSTKS